MSLFHRILHALFSAAVFIAAFVGFAFRLFGSLLGMSGTFRQLGALVAIYAMVYYLVAFTRLITGGDPDTAGGWHLSVLGCLIATGIAGCFVMLPQASDETDIVAASIVIIDVVCPLLALADWAFLSKKGRMHMEHVLGVAIPLAVWCVFAWETGPSLGWAYSFLNVDKLGALAVVLRLIAMVILGAFVAAVLVLADERMAPVDEEDWE
jgi:hypothetical protein